MRYLKDKNQKSRKKGIRLKNKKILVTAGPTRENIDPVRFLSNMSTGKMGYAIAESLAENGALVTLISGPVAVGIRHPNIRLIHVTSAREMFEQSVMNFPDCNAAILSAAVSDYTPVREYKKKIKRRNENLIIELKPTDDIAETLGRMKQQNQVLVGFALESENEINNAVRKIKKKNLDFIVLNSLRDEGAGFGTDTNRVIIIDRDNNIEKFELKLKKEVAKDIITKLEKYFKED
jgi:phosphopantothenoylcysteine decarboxylase/phosphopantothenate--cysteine ligase